MVRKPVGAPQPGGRAPAPAGLALVQDFANTFWRPGQGGETLAEPADLAGWTTAHGLPAGGPVGRRELTRALDLREGLRGLLYANNGLPPDAGLQARLDRALGGMRLALALGPAGPALAPADAGVEGALEAIAAAVARAMLDGDFARLKACPGPHCGWAFYDHSRNGGGRWCSMSVCGSRVKARAYYRRRRLG